MREAFASSIMAINYVTAIINPNKTLGQLILRIVLFILRNKIKVFRFAASQGKQHPNLQDMGSFGFLGDGHNDTGSRPSVYSVLDTGFRSF